MRRPSPSIVISALALLVASSGTAYAASGRALILGQGNLAHGATVLRDSIGPALDLVAPAGTSPLEVNNPQEVRRFNANYLQGRLASDLGAVESARVIGLPPAPVCTSRSMCILQYFGAVAGVSTASRVPDLQFSLSPNQYDLAREPIPALGQSRPCRQSRNR